jgi:predicted amidohydrolase YtcJ
MWYEFSPEISPAQEVLRMAAKYGYRISGMHVSGDLAVDQFLNEVEEVEKTYPDVASR